MFAASAFALDVPKLDQQVTDLAQVLDPQHRAALESKLETYERATGHQFALLTLPTLDGDAIEDFSIRVTDAWKLGDKKRDDGLLLVLAMAEHKLRIEVGLGLQGEVTDAFSAQVIRDVIAPAMREGRAADGLDRAFDLLMAKAQGIEVGVPKPRMSEEQSPIAAGAVVFIVILVLLLSRFGGGGGGGGRRRRGGMLFLPGAFGGGGGGFGGGGFGGGGGGFGGGGGGFNGGGASGDW